jgi:hypothetical protein
MIYQGYIFQGSIGQEEKRPAILYAIKCLLLLELNRRSGSTHVGVLTNDPLANLGSRLKRSKSRITNPWNNYESTQGGDYTCAVYSDNEILSPSAYHLLEYSELSLQFSSYSLWSLHPPTSALYSSEYQFFAFECILIVNPLPIISSV